MIKDFSQVMSERTDKQLVDIVTFKRNEYQPEALLAAEQELARRQLTADTFYRTEEFEEIEEIKNSDPADKAEMTFDLSHKIGTVVLPSIIITLWTLMTEKLEGFMIFKGLGFSAIVFAHYGIFRWLKNNGYTERAKEFIKWSAYTLYIYIALLVIVGLSIYFSST